MNKPTKKHLYALVKSHATMIKQLAMSYGYVVGMYETRTGETVDRDKINKKVIKHIKEEESSHDKSNTRGKENNSI